MSTALSRATRRSRSAPNADAAAGCSASFFADAKCIINFSDPEDGRPTNFITGDAHAVGNGAESCSNTGTEGCRCNRYPK